MKTTSRSRRRRCNSTGPTLAARGRKRPASLGARSPPEPPTAEARQPHRGNPAADLREAFGLRALERRFGLPLRSSLPRNSADKSDALRTLRAVAPTQVHPGVRATSTIAVQRGTRCPFSTQFCQFREFCLAPNQDESRPINVTQGLFSPSSDLWTPMTRHPIAGNRSNSVKIGQLAPLAK